MYGLRRAPLWWFDTINPLLTKLGFKALNHVKRRTHGYLYPWPLDLNQVWPENIDKRRDAATQFLALRQANMEYRLVDITGELVCILLGLNDKGEEMDLDFGEDIDDIKVYDMEIDY